MTDRPSWAPPGIDLSVPSVSRVYDFFLGGSHNFEVDREAARHVLKSVPAMPKVGQANRAMMRRAVRYAAGRGIGQFLDIGSGIPTFGNVHEVVHGLDPRANVVYVDNDPVAVEHSKAVLEGNAHAAIAAADLRAPRSVLDHPEVRRMLDLDRPVALLLVAVLHFLSESDDPYGVVATLRDALAPGSVLILTHATRTPSDRDLDDEMVKGAEVYRRTSTPLTLRSVPEVERFFTGFELLEPGLVPMPYWRPDTPPGDDVDPAVLTGFAGVGLKA